MSPFHPRRARSLAQKVIIRPRYARGASGVATEVAIGSTHQVRTDKLQDHPWQIPITGYEPTKIRTSTEELCAGLWFSVRAVSEAGRIS